MLILSYRLVILFTLSLLSLTPPSRPAVVCAPVHRLRNLTDRPMVASLTTKGVVPTKITVPMPPADSTANRIEPKRLTNVPIRSVADLRQFLTSPQTNKRGVVAKGVYELGAGTLAQTAPWTNVLLTAPSGATILTTATTALLLTDSHALNRVKFDNLTFQSTSTGGGDAIVHSNELVSFRGLEFAYCRFVGTQRGHYNAFGIVQYSTHSKQGASSGDLYAHHCYFTAPRMGLEILSQGYDVARLNGLVLTHNRIENTATNPDEAHRMAASFSGLITRIYFAHNTSTNAKNIAFEFVNTKYVLAAYNTARATLETCVGYSITDDEHHSTEQIDVVGGSFNMSSRPFQLYGCKNVRFTGGMYVGRRGVDMQTEGSSFDDLTILVNSTEVEPAWQFAGSSHNNSLTNCRISTWGSAAVGKHPSFETVVLRPGTYANRLTNLQLRQGKKPDKTYYTDGKVVNQGALSNTATGITVQLEP